MKTTRFFSALLFALGLSLSMATGAVVPNELKKLPAGQWRMYTAAMEPGNSAPCCIEFRRGKVQRDGAACSLESDNWSFSSDDSRTDAQLEVYVRGDGKGGVDRMRAFGTACAVDVAAQQVERIELSAAAQLELLQHLTGKQAGVHEDLRKSAISVLALTAGPQADQALAALAGAEHSKDVRHDALFWLTQTRGQMGFDVVLATLKDAQTPLGLRKHAVFALSQSDVAGRDAALIALSREDQSRSVRGEALFWLAQTSPAAAEPVLLAAVRADHPELREKAIFGLSQLPDDRAVATLSILAKDRSLPRETRKQALFWLSQTDQAGALPELEKLLAWVISLPPEQTSRSSLGGPGQKLKMSLRSMTSKQLGHQPADQRLDSPCGTHRHLPVRPGHINQRSARHHPRSCSAACRYWY